MGFASPGAAATSRWPGRGILRECAACGYQCSVTAGTIFQDTRTPLRLWFQAMWWMTTQKNGASALGLQRVLGLKQYQTAWTWLHKLRSAMVRPGRDLLTGRIEVDECYLGALEEGLRGRLIESNALIVVAAQENGRGLGESAFARSRMLRQKVFTPSSSTQLPPAACIHTDGWRGYSGIETKGYLRQITVLKGRKEPASELLPRVHLVISLLKRWLMGTHQGAVSHKHLAYYLDEFTFRFNRRKSASRGKLFYRLSSKR